MTAEEVIDFFAPHQSSVDVVIEWLLESGFERERIGHSTNKQWIQLDATTAEAEALLFADFFIWEHETTGAHDISTEAYHIPVYLQEHIDYVTPGTRLRTKRAEVLRLGKNKRGFSEGATPFITQLPGFPNPNSTTCSVFVTRECTQGKSYRLSLAVSLSSGNQANSFSLLPSSVPHPQRYDGFPG